MVILKSSLYELIPIYSAITVFWYLRYKLIGLQLHLFNRWPDKMVLDKVSQHFNIIVLLFKE